MATQSIPAGFKLVPDDGGSNKPPEARGKAAALSAYLARGGTPFKMSGRYKKGPMKGRTVDEATARFESMWASAPDSIKEKYASRSQKTDLAPSERPPIDRPSTNASLNASLPGETPTQREARQRASRTKNDPKPPVTPPAGSSFAELTKPVPVPADGVKSIGDGSFPGKPMNMVDTRPVDTASKLTGKSRAEQAAMLMEDAKANPPTASQKVAQSTVPPVPAPSAPQQTAGKPFAGAKPPDINGQIGGVMKTAGAGIMAAAGNMARPGDYGSTLTNTTSPADMKRDDEAKVAAMSTKPTTPASTMATPASTQPAKPMAQSDAPPPPPVAAPIQGPPRSAMNPQAPTGKPIMGDAPKGVNRLTGLPMGYKPGDDVSGSDRQTQERAAQSVTRQQQAVAPPVAPPRATIAPAPVRYADAQSQYQKELDPAKAKEMDKVYSGANSMDQARITAQSLKRAGSLNRSQTPAPARRPVRAR